jgi:two-component system, response regulator
LAQGGGGETLEVLLVEDNIGDVVLIRNAIAESGLPVKLTTAMDGEQALRILNSGLLPALVILDLNLPKVSGLKVLERRPQCAAPIVVFSSSDNTHEISQALALGACDYVRKPTEIEAYTTAVRGLIVKWARGFAGS